MRTSFFCLICLCSALAQWSCRGKSDSFLNSFTKADSVTDSYLAFQDSLFQSWNIMINDDDQKIIAMHNLVHELIATSTDDRGKIQKFEEQLHQLVRIRYTQKSMGNSDVVEEYDFASVSLVRELISTAESKTEYRNSIILQKLVDDIRLAEERVNNYREDYDDLVWRYNYFIEENQSYLTEIDSDSLQKKHLFQMVSAE